MDQPAARLHSPAAPESTLGTRRPGGRRDSAANTAGGRRCTRRPPRGQGRGPAVRVCGEPGPGGAVAKAQGASWLSGASVKAPHTAPP